MCWRRWLVYNAIRKKILEFRIFLQGLQILYFISRDETYDADGVLVFVNPDNTNLGEMQVLLFFSFQTLTVKVPGLCLCPVNVWFCFLSINWLC